MHSLVFGRKRSGLSTGVKMRSVMIAAVGSGSGKTIVTAGLLMALKKRNIAVRSFKCGPDYIDPMFHTRVLGLPCRNLDLFLLGERGVLRELSGIEGSDIPQETSGGRDDFSSDVLKRNQESAMQESAARHTCHSGRKAARPERHAGCPDLRAYEFSAGESHNWDHSE